MTGALTPRNEARNVCCMQYVAMHDMLISMQSAGGVSVAGVTGNVWGI